MDKVTNSPPTSETRWLPVDDARALDEVIARSHQEPVLLLNYDPHCPINLMARMRLAGLGADLWVVDVARNHRLGQLVAAKTGVRHESPQMILLRDGQATWSASHHGISAAAARAALAR